MSAINGDKARFNRLRKQKIARRIRNRELMQRLAQGRKTQGSTRSPSPATGVFVPPQQHVI